MTVNYIVKLVEGLGVPLAVALAGGIGLWKLIAFVLKDLKTDVADKQDELQASLKLQHTMIVRLIDRIRTLEINTMMANTALLTVGVGGYVVGRSVEKTGKNLTVNRK